MTPDKNSLRTVSVMFCWVTNNIKISVAYIKHILMLPGMQCGCRAIDLSWAWLGQARLQPSRSQVSSSIFILESRLKQRLLNALLFTDRRSTGVYMEARDTAFLRLLRATCMLSPSTSHWPKQVISPIPKSKDQEYMPHP